MSQSTQRVAVITGAAGGIGRATVQLFKQDGWYVVGLDRLESSGGDRHLRADHAVVEDIDAAFEALKDLGRVDAVINNAATHIPNHVVDITPDEWDIVMATNGRAAYLVSRAAHPMMREHGGSVVNVASVHALATSQGVAAYAASKGALLALTRASALDLASDNIRVNAVLPGAVDTPMLLAGVSAVARQAAIQALSSRTPLHRIAQPEEIAQAILFLSDGNRASFITGQALVVDGGALARLSSE